MGKKGGGFSGGGGGGGRGGKGPRVGGGGAHMGFAMPGPPAGGLDGIKKMKKNKVGGRGDGPHQQKDGGSHHHGGSAKSAGSGGGSGKHEGGKNGRGAGGQGAPFVALSREVLVPGADSREVSRRIFELMIHPITAEEFYRDYFEKKPLLISRKNRHYYDEWIRMSHVRQLIDTDELEWTYEVDVTSYRDGERQTHNGEQGEGASKDEIWRMHKEEGCSVRLLRPQKRLDHMCLLLSLLDEHWGSGAGANVYLTPAGHQGFAPHWDDIEAFVLQTEGSKNWRVYAPRSEAEEMPRFSSRNFAQTEVGNPILECEVHAGDLLYFPRGFIHQAVSGGEKHSLHVTVSFGYRNSWYDFVKSTIEAALEDARKEDIRLRRSMPRDYLLYMGGLHSGSTDPRRGEVGKRVKALMSGVLARVENAMDAGADDRARTLLKERLPICLGASEGGTREDLEEEREDRAGKVVGKSKIRVVRAGVGRLQGEGEVVVLYNCIDNSREYHGAEEQGLDFDPVYSEAIQGLLRSYPKYTEVRKLLGDLDEEEKVELAQVLVSNGLVEVCVPSAGS